ncbi:MAG: CinA family protein [Marmoricola sp.]
MSPEALQARLLARGETVCCAESLTGGSLASLLSETPGASAVFLGGVVSYATEVKRSVLGVTAPLVVSAECAIEMATGVRGLLGADWAVSTTGVAGPESQEDQPVGTVYVGVAGPEGARAVRLDLEGSREEIRAATCAAAVSELYAALS